MHLILRLANLEGKERPFDSIYLLLLEIESYELTDEISH